MRLIVFIPVIAGVVLISHHTCLAENRKKNELPMFGGGQGEWFEESREMSQKYSRMAWTAFYNNQSDEAMRRFNQAWLYDKRSADPYWGFGIICGQRAVAGEEPDHNFADSVKCLETARGLDPKNARLLVDYATSLYNLAGYHDTRGDAKSAKSLLTDAKDILIQAKTIDPNYERADAQLELVQKELKVSDQKLSH